MARGILRWTGKALLWLVVVLLVLAAVGMVYQAVATERAEGRILPPARRWTWATTSCTSTA